jgi:hypothetical protein
MFIAPDILLTPDESIRWGRTSEDWTHCRQERQTLQQPLNPVQTAFLEYPRPHPSSCSESLTVRLFAQGVVTDELQCLGACIRAANMQYIYSQTSIQEVGLNLDFNQKLNTVGEHRFISKTFSYQHSTADFVSKIDTRLTRSWCTIQAPYMLHNLLFLFGYFSPLEPFIYFLHTWFF